MSKKDYNQIITSYICAWTSPLTNVVLPYFFRNFDISPIYAVIFVSPLNLVPCSVGVPTVPSNSPPFRQNFMFDVPLASVPAVLMCWLISLAGTNNSAKDTCKSPSDLISHVNHQNRTNGIIRQKENFKVLFSLRITVDYDSGIYDQSNRL